MRKASQVEVSATDAIKLGMQVPIRESGDVKGSAPIAVVGPKGAIYLKEGCIVAMRHIHMSPKDAQAAGVTDGQIVSVRADNERGTIFNHVKIRVDPSFTLEMHIDTDEANASKKLPLAIQLPSLNNMQIPLSGAGANDYSSPIGG